MKESNGVCGRFFVGPLDFDLRLSQANTVMGAKLELDATSVKALYTLALNEGLPVSFESLYREIWKPVGVYDRAVAEAAIKHIIHQVDKAGKGFMWVTHNPNEGYTFHSRWGHNWKTQQPKPPPDDDELPEPPAQVQIQKRARRKLIPKITAAAGLLAASMIIAFSPLFTRPPEPTEYFYLPDDPVPLAPFGWEWEECEYYCEYCDEELDDCECDDQ